MPSFKVFGPGGQYEIECEEKELAPGRKGLVGRFVGKQPPTLAGTHFMIDSDKIAGAIQRAEDGSFETTGCYVFDGRCSDGRT
jgi:hypothetical protein